MDNKLQVQKQKKELSLRQMVDIETRNRQIMTEYITKHMKRGVDYGAIHINKNCPNRWNPSKCSIAEHFSKDSLFKAGAEKVASLLKLRPEIEMVKDAWEMAGSSQGLFFFRCRLYSRQNNELVAEGMGACSIDEKQGNANNAIKIGKKRAFVDAVLSAGALSDFFTQDLEDIQTESAQEVQVVSSKEQATEIGPFEELLATANQKLRINILLGEKGYKLAQLLGKYEVGTLAELTVEQADTIISNLMKLPAKQVEPPITDEDMEAFERSIR